MPAGDAPVPSTISSGDGHGDAAGIKCASLGDLPSSEADDRDPWRANRAPTVWRVAAPPPRMPFMGRSCCIVGYALDARPPMPGGICNVPP